MSLTTSIALVLMMSSPAFANQEKFQIAMQNSSKVICNAFHYTYESLNKKTDASKKLEPYKTEIANSCSIIKVEQDKHCHAAFMVKFAEMTKTETANDALKVQAKKVLVPELEKCLKQNGKKLAVDMDVVLQLFHFGKIEDARNKLAELKK